MTGTKKPLEQRVTELEDIAGKRLARIEERLDALLEALTAIEAAKETP